MHSARILTAALVAGIGAARLVETVKEALPVIPPPAAKSMFASAIAATLGATLGDGSWRERTLAAVGSIGVAMLAHDTTALLSVISDRQKVVVMRAAGQR